MANGDQQNAQRIEFLESTLRTTLERQQELEQCQAEIEIRVQRNQQAVAESEATIAQMTIRIAALLQEAEGRDSAYRETKDENLALRKQIETMQQEMNLLLQKNHDLETQLLLQNHEKLLLTRENEKLENEIENLQSQITEQNKRWKTDKEKREAQREAQVFEKIDKQVRNKSCSKNIKTRLALQAEMESKMRDTFKEICRTDNTFSKNATEFLLKYPYYRSFSPKADQALKLMKAFLSREDYTGFLTVLDSVSEEDGNSRQVEFFSLTCSNLSPGKIVWKLAEDHYPDTARSYKDKVYEILLTKVRNQRCHDNIIQRTESVSNLDNHQASIRTVFMNLMEVTPTPSIIVDSLLDKFPEFLKSERVHKILDEYKRRVPANVFERICQQVDAGPIGNKAAFPDTFCALVNSNKSPYQIVWDLNSEFFPRFAPVGQTFDHFKYYFGSKVNNLGGK